MRRIAVGMLFVTFLVWTHGLIVGYTGRWSEAPWERYFSVDGSGNVVLSAPLQVTRLGVGVAPSSYNGTIKAAPNYNAGNVLVLDTSSASGSPDGNDYLLYASTTQKWTANNILTGNYITSAQYFSGNIRTDSVLSYSGSAEPAFPKGLKTASGYGIGIGESAPASEIVTANGSNWPL